jgi:hypothetical protein
MGCVQYIAYREEECEEQGNRDEQTPARAKAMRPEEDT